MGETLKAAAWERAVSLTEGGHKVRIGDARLIYKVVSKDALIDLSSLQVAQNKRRKGQARAAMGQLCQVADQKGFRIELIASALDKRTGTPGLIRFYESLGFHTGRKANMAGEPFMIRPATRSKQAGILICAACEDGDCFPHGSSVSVDSLVPWTPSNSERPLAGGSPVVPGTPHKTSQRTSHPLSYDPQDILRESKHVAEQGHVRNADLTRNISQHSAHLKNSTPADLATVRSTGKGSNTGNRNSVVPLRLYHTSPMRNRNGIEREGLLSERSERRRSVTRQVRNNPGVYGFETPEAFEPGGQWEHNPEFHDIWEIDTANDVWRRDEASGMEGSWYTRGDAVSPHKLRLFYAAPGRTKTALLEENNPVLQERRNAETSKTASPDDLDRLRGYLTLDDRDKGEELARMFHPEFQEYIESEHAEYTDLVETGEDEFLEDYSGFPDEVLTGFLESFGHEAAKYVEAPTFLSVDFVRDIKDEWLVHFTDRADQVAREGFKYGIADPGQLALTTYFTDGAKQVGGYNFAYRVKDLRFREPGKYGRHCVVFQASGIEIWHHGDEEPQVIFWGADARNIVPVTEASGEWEVRPPSGESEPLSVAESVPEIVDWVRTHGREYLSSPDPNRSNSFQGKQGSLNRMALSTHGKRARHIRKVSTTGDLEKTMRKATSVLAEFGIPSLVVGGYAVQENGYPRYTADVDIVVPDVAAARGKLSINGFRENPGSSMTVTDRATKVEVDLMPGGGQVGPGPLLLPMPQVVSKSPTVADLPTLLAIKLSSYIGSGVGRLKDLADVTELVKANHSPRDLALPDAVAELYRNVWDGIHHNGVPDPKLAAQIGIPA